MFASMQAMMEELQAAHTCQTQSCVQGNPVEKRKGIRTLTAYDFYTYHS